MTTPNPELRASSTKAVPRNGRARLCAREASGDGFGRLFTVDELAEFLHVARSWVYAHADDLGAWRLGNGPKAPLRFDLEIVRERLTVCPDGRKSGSGVSGTVEPKQRARRRRSSGSEVELLPIRGGLGRS